MPIIRNYGRLKPLRLGLGIALVVLFILFVKHIGTDDEADIVLNQRLQKLSEQITASSPPIPPVAAKKRSQDTIGVEEYNKKYGRPLRAASTSSKCQNYIDFAKELHEPFSDGPLKLPSQRPPLKCRTFTSSKIDHFIDQIISKFRDPDLAKLFENAFPNTLDTTILHHKPSTGSSHAETFVVTGDIHAEWLRDAARQLSVYQNFTRHDPKLRELIRGAINTQASYVLISPYCNAFHPPPNSGIKRGTTAFDKVTPQPNWKWVFECKWEVDSLASFLTLTNEYFEKTQDVSIFSDLWINAMLNVLTVLKRESSPTFNAQGDVLPFYYTFQRDTNIGTETLPLAGTGNPVNYDIGLIRSAFRPSDDATIFQFFIPGNAHLQVELYKIAKTLQSYFDFKSKPEYSHHVEIIIEQSFEFSQKIKDAIYKHGIVNHPEFGKVFAYEIDGYGGINLMDDANIPSLLSLPDLGFLSADDEIYQNTRSMILSKRGNPYFLQGKHFKGIGGPHIGIHSAWPMSLLVQIRTSSDDEEIKELLNLILKTTDGLGLIHESIRVDYPNGNQFTRPWFSWANSEFGKTILFLLETRPHLILKNDYLKEIGQFNIADYFRQ